MVEADSTGVETTPSELESVSELEKKIIRQIEYYFGDINLARDKFLQEQIKLDDGWVPLETMLKFERLALLSKDPLVITKAISKSTEKLVEVSEDNTKIRRSPNKPILEMNDARRKELMSRTIYCKGFPKEDTHINDLLDFFPQFGKIDNVVMRRYKDKAADTWVFKGSAFIVFSTVEGAKSFLEESVVKYKDIELIRKWQNDYQEEKRKERLSKSKSKQKTKNEQGDDEDTGNKEPPKEEEEFPRGSVIQLKDLGETDVSREDIKAAIEKSGIGVAFIDFRKGESEATVRLDSEGAALELAGKIKEGVLEIKENVKCEMRVLEGEEEEVFLTKALEDKKKHQKFRHKGGYRGRGGYGGRGKKRRHGHGDYPSKKVAKFDE